MVKREAEPAVTKLFWVPIYFILFYSVKEVLLDVWRIAVRVGNLFYRLLWVVVFPLLVIIYPATVLVMLLAVLFFWFVTLVNYLFGGINYVSDSLFLKLRGIGLTCPGCHKKYTLPTYVCTCGRKHKHLRPGKYGIFKRKCNCGKKLPTTFFNGRQKIDAICPNCGYSFQSKEVAKQITIPIIGGTMSGKTCLINAAIDSVASFCADPKNKLEFKYCTADDEKRHQRNLAELKSGRTAQKTIKQQYDSYKFYISPKGAKVKNRVYIYDVAGEVYDKERDNIVEKAAMFEYTKSLLFIVDPLSIDDFYEECQSAGVKNLDAYKRSDRSTNNIVQNMLNSLNGLGVSENELKETFVAIAITKSDIPLVQQKLGDQTVEDVAKQNRITFAKAKNIVCEEFLNQYGAGNVLSMLKQKFEKYQFFTTSAWNGEENKYENKSAGDPFLWLINMESSQIDLKDKWNKNA